LRLADLGIPVPVVDRFVASGVKSGLVYPWQRAAIDEGADGSSLVYCAPTSGGKSLVANVLLVRRLVRRMRSGRPARALVVLPLPPR
jgi:DNA polymerase theta